MSLKLYKIILNQAKILPYIEHSLKSEFLLYLLSGKKMTFSGFLIMTSESKSS